jgi:hypothetical protein
MITEQGLMSICNGLAGAAMCLIVVYHFVAVNAKKMEAAPSK